VKPLREATKKVKDDHVFIDLNDGKWKCQHCKLEYQFNYPAPMNVLDAAMKAFLKDHRRCKKP